MIHNIPQPDFEDFVRKHLQSDPNVEIQKGVAFVSCEQVKSFPDGPVMCENEQDSHFQATDDVIATVEERDTKKTFRIRSRHVVGCDGAKSQVRKWLGIESEGEDSCEQTAWHCPDLNPEALLTLQ